MKTIQVFDKAMCCASGVCGSQVDPVLPRFAADLEWLRSRGVPVERYNLAQQAFAFTQNAEVCESLKTHGIECLPLVIVDGQIASRGQYPSRESLSRWAGVAPYQEELTVISGGETCCGESGCC